MATDQSGSSPASISPMTLEPSLTAPPTATPNCPASSYFLPGNPMPYLAPSATHQPELLLLAWMLSILSTLVAGIQHHPLVSDPVPHPSSFTDQHAYRLYLQFRNTLRHLGNITADIQQGISILQFLPVSPGSPGHYRMDPTASFPPSTTNNFLSTPLLASMYVPTPQPPQHRLINHLIQRDRSRSRDRQPTTTPSASLRNPNLHTSIRQPLSDITHLPPSSSHRSHLHQSLWTATTTTSDSTSSPPPLSWTMTPRREADAHLT